MNTMKPSMQTRELMSALVDGQLGGDDVAAALQACELDPSALTRWNTYHLIGEALRAPVAVSAIDVQGGAVAFADRLSQRLAQEPPVKQERPAGDVVFLAPDPKTSAGQVVHHRGPASNDGNFRWKLVAGFASLAAVSAIAWNTSGFLPPAFAPQLARGPGTQQVVVASPQGPVVRDARLEELLAAHRQLGGTSALQEPSGFLRNATFETPPGANR